MRTLEESVLDCEAIFDPERGLISQVVRCACSAKP